jgi:hypothetical protein
MHRWIILLLSVITCFKAKSSTNLTSLNNNGIALWEAKVFSGKSIYAINHHQGRSALQALSESSAFGLVLKNKIALTITPYINWSWLVEKILHGLNERSKSGDDFVARIYVVIDGGFMVWKTNSLNYVWSSNQAKGLVWDNPFAGSIVKMMSIERKESQTSKWYEEKRNVYQDLIDIFGGQGSEKANLKAYNHIDIIAIMTDTDNSGK